MNFKSLKNISENSLFNAFSNAFSDYEMQLDQKQLQSLLKRRGFNPELSYGAFDKDTLVAFTFNGIGNYNNILTAYDTGTGTTKEYRGKGLAKKIFEYSIPYLKEKGIHQYLLEVLQHNKVAYHLYSKMGFRVIREFYYYVCQKNSLAIRNRPLDKNYFLKDNIDFNSSGLYDFWDFNPSWQNSFDSFNRQSDAFNSIGAYYQDKLIGYLVFEPLSGDISQIAVHKEHRRNNIATTLIKEVLTRIETSEIKIINTDLSCDSMNSFLESLKIKATGKQFEMIKEI